MIEADAWLPRECVNCEKPGRPLRFAGAQQQKDRAVNLLNTEISFKGLSCHLFSQKK